MLTEKELLKLCQSAVAAAKAAGIYIQSQFNRHHEIRDKASGTSLASQVVTNVDLRAQEIILNHLNPTFQQFELGVLTEESVDDHSRLEKPYFWCIDPLDGTLPFTEGRTGYAVSMALITRAGDPIIGVVYVPDRDECYATIKGHGVKLNNRPFDRVPMTPDNLLQMYLDGSLKKENNFQALIAKLNVWCSKNNMAGVDTHFGFGAVCNALAVMNAAHGCYVKLPKPQDGGGSIWDFGATRLLFEELNLQVSTFTGETLHLNHPGTTFMNHAGVIYATDSKLVHFVSRLRF
jgi:3'(2'), 5'-bisphosphate nucleotidase